MVQKNTAELKEMGCVHILCDQSPTNCGSDDVHAAGSMVSKALVKPWMILNPETLAVMEPSVMAARAVIDK